MATFVRSVEWIAVILRARAVFFGGASIYLAVLMAHSISWFGFWLGFFLIIAGISIGVYWESLAEARLYRHSQLKVAPSVPSVPKWIEFLGYVLYGLLFGTIPSLWLGSGVLCVVVVFAAIFIFGIAAQIIFYRKINFAQLGFVGFSLNLGLLLFLSLRYWYA
jgi:hypothetical protein